MSSLFAGTDRLICQALGIRRRQDLNQRSAEIRRLSEGDAFRLISGMYGRLVANYPGEPHSDSTKLWLRRHAPRIADHNRTQTSAGMHRP